MYKIETHLHTLYGSGCGKMNERQIVSGYIAAGYHGLIVTDHYNRDTRWYPARFPNLPGTDLYGFLEGYDRVKEEGERRGLKVYKGAELRFDGSPNDYLLIGYSDDLLREPEKVFRMGLEAFSRYARQDGAILIQAHPCRNSCQPPCTPAEGRWLDGVEIFNGNPRAHNQNEKAEAFACSMGHLIRLSGSDCHQPEDIGLGGIYTGRLPQNDRELVRLLKERKYTLIY